MEEMILPAQTDSLYQALDFVRQFAENHGFQEELFQIELAAEEVFTNIVCYAYGSSCGMVEVVCRMAADADTHEADNDEKGCGLDPAGDKLQICFMDTGIPYNPLGNEDPDITLPANVRPVGGLGVFLIKKFMDHIFYEYREGKNILTIEKSRRKRRS